MIDSIVDRAETEVLRGFDRVINATGTILHTNLGRAPLSLSAREAMDTVSGYCDLELDLATGGRGSRQARVESLLNLLLGSDASLVVCNNAAAILMAVTVVGARRDVIVSRGEAVEIGDGFRIPTIVRQSGARLVEVGTTNRTTSADYGEAVNDRTAAILKVHPSNFALIGFTEQVSIEDLAVLSHDKSLPLVADNGSGPLVDTAAFGLAHEPMPSEALSAGADLVTFSSDKLLGGPQGGIVAGRRDMLQRIRRHPLTRALRPDKMILAALHATLLHYAAGSPLTVPVLRMLSMSLEEIEGRAAPMVDRWRNAGVEASIELGESTIGGGSLPGQTLPTALIRIALAGSASSYSRRLRTLRVPVVARVSRDEVLLDLRTVEPQDEMELVEAILMLH